MKTDIWFNVDAVIKITVRYEYDTHLFFYPRKTGRTVKIFGITLFKTPILPNRWSYYEENDDDYKTDEHIRKSENYRVQEFPKRVFYKSYVNISLIGDEEVTFRFDSNDEANEFVSLIVSQSKNNFEVIKKES